MSEEKKPSLEETFAEIETIIEKLESGELDLALLTPKDAAAFAGDDAYTCYDMKTSDYRGILYNFNKSHFSFLPFFD